MPRPAGAEMPTLIAPTYGRGASSAGMPTTRNSTPVWAAGLAASSNSRFEAITTCRTSETARLFTCRGLGLHCGAPQT